MNENHDLLRGEPQPSRRVLIENGVDEFDLEEMVPAAQRSELVPASALGAIGYAIGPCTSERALSFDAFDVLHDTLPVGSNEVRDPLRKKCVHLCFVEA